MTTTWVLPYEPKTWIRPLPPSEVPDLLPPNATKLERDLATTIGAFLGALRVDISNLWDAKTCPVAFLPSLAWALSVDVWDEEWSESTKRIVIEEARIVHAEKGTLSAVRRVLGYYGHGDATVIERCAGGIRYSGQLDVTRNNTYRRGGSGLWATYKVILKRPITRDISTRMRTALFTAKRNCVHLVEFDFTQAAWRHNNTIVRNGACTYGTTV